MKKTLLFVSFCCMLNTVYAFGSRDITETELVTPESWQETVDISTKKKGKYNILITARDIAGNVGYAGPFNMYIDPASDLPVTSIAFPSSGADVSGNVDIVGTCYDDDDVSQVSLRIDNGEQIYTAKGTEFWSYALDTASLAEGVHTVEVWGVDVNGVQGKSVKTSFNLDRRQPVTSVTNTAAGTLVSGTVQLEGTVEDGNGIDRLFYSLDNGNKFEEVRLSYNKKLNRSVFKIPVKTQLLSDGPNVCWFKAIDKQGSAGIYTFLFFVDNVAPTLSFIYPDNETETFPSVFSVAGKAADSTGLESLSWVCGKESGDIPLTPGNDYWVREFDFTRTNAKSVLIEFVAKDVAGNVVSERKKIEIDKAKDKPGLEIASPKAGEKIDGALFISGVGYGKASEIRYRIDKGEEKIAAVSDSTGTFAATEEALSAGNHTLFAYAVNADGRAGDVQSVQFSLLGKAPVISFESGGTVIPVYGAQNKVSTAVRIKAEAGLREVLVGFNGEEEKAFALKEGQTEFTVRPPVNDKTAAGIYAISVSATDTAGRAVRQKLLIGIADNGKAGTPSDLTAFAWAGNRLGNAVLIGDEPLTGLYYPANGAQIESAELTGGAGSGDLSLEVAENVVKITGAKDGTYNDVRVTIRTSDGREMTSESIDILVDTAFPTITLNANAAYVKNSVTFSGSVSGTQLPLEYRLSSASSDEVLTGTLEGRFEKTLDVKDFSDGALLLTVVVADAVGKKTSEHRIFIKDTEAPDVRMVMPASGDKVNGSVTAAFTIEEKFGGVKAEYKADDKNSAWKEFPYASLSNVVIGSASEPIGKNMQFRFTDDAGNSRIIDRYDFDIDTALDAPVVEIHLPFENQVIVKDFDISGIVYDDDAPAKIYYKIDNAPYTALDIKHTFSIPVALSSLTDNEHMISIYGEDIYGVKSAPVERKIRVSLEKPSAQMTSPDISETVKGLITISGTASDANGIGEVYLSVNNGNSFLRTEGTEKWSYSLNTQVLGDGTHVVLIKAIDKYGQESISSTLINTDNTPPLLEIEYPLAGSALDKDLFISGQAWDTISLEGVTLKVKSLSNTTVPSSLAQIKLNTEVLIAENVDISSLPEGRYNLEISGIDKAGNTNEASVNFDVSRKADKNKIELLYPLNGQTLCGEFNVYGRVDPSSNIKQVSLFIDGKQITTSDVSVTSYASFRLNPDVISEGTHTIEIKGILPANQTVISSGVSVQYKVDGPWITIDNLAMGDFAIDRPYLKGSAGYAVSQAEKDTVFAKDASADAKRLFAAKRLKQVEVSFNNGRTFVPATLKNGWRYRIETEDLAEGNHFLLVRAVMENKEVAICRTIIKVDKTVPNITLISPGEGGRYNGSITFTGLVSDNIALQDADAALRKGDKATYGVPKFIQGLHFELGFWGATLWNAGVGLSFFDDNVKLQFHYGQFTQSQFDWFYKTQDRSIRQIRYGGHVGSIKLLANVFELPFGYYFGPDWQWLYLNVAVGAQFSLFSETQSGKPQVLSAGLVQLEFPRVKLYKRKRFSSFSFFTEGQLWFVSTDVDGPSIKAVMPHISGGVRVNVF